MGKDRIKRIALHVRGTIVVAAGRMTGDAQIAANGRVERSCGAAQNGIGWLTD